MLQKVPEADFALQRPADELGVYGKRSFSKHHFCRTCGLQVFTRITDERGFRGGEPQLRPDGGRRQPRSIALRWRHTTVMDVEGEAKQTPQPR